MNGTDHDPGETRVDPIPPLGLGTWENTDPHQCVDSVRTALDVGYRHIDTAQAYGNEPSVGEGLDAAAVDREDVFLATKIWIDNLAYDDVIASTKTSLDRLGTDYIDLLYVHWPARTYTPERTLAAFQELQADDYITHIGVSNFPPDALETAIDILDDPPLANQVECHPYLPQRELRAVCADHDVELVAYSPLARGTVLEDSTVTSIARTHDVSPAQVALAWLRFNGIPTIPKATSTDHIRDNWESRSLDLSANDIERIDSIEARDRQVDPPFAPWN